MLVESQRDNLEKFSAALHTHVPYQDEPALSSMLKFFEYYRPDAHMIMGDFCDMEGISHWPSSELKPRRLVPELLEAKALIKRIVDSTVDCTTRIYLTGNHEDWLDQACTAQMPQLFDGLPQLGVELTLSKLLDLEGFEYQLYPLNHIVRIGKAGFTHGLYTGGSHAKKHLSVLKTNIYYGHLHDTQSHNETSIDGPMEAHSLGCLAKLDAKFLKGKPNNWVHSFGVFEFFPDGSYTFMCPKIINGKMSYNGIIFDGNKAEKKGKRKDYDDMPVDAVDLY